MGILLSIFRSQMGDCSNAGLSSRHLALTLVNANGPFNPTGEAPPVILIRRDLRDGHAIPTIYPAYNDRGLWRRTPLPWMFGGTYLSGDDRLSDTCLELGIPRPYGPIPFHDRVE